jgi:hypothetical protein
MPVMKAAVHGLMMERAATATDRNIWLRITVVMAVSLLYARHTPALTVPFILTALTAPDSLPTWCHPRTLLLLNVLRHSEVYKV